jgi:hypothetical protein
MKAKQNEKSRRGCTSHRSHFLDCHRRSRLYRALIKVPNRLGCAGTIYKGPARTLDHTYLYHSEHWRNATSYVALTRLRENLLARPGPAAGVAVVPFRA